MQTDDRKVWGNNPHYCWNDKRTTFWNGGIIILHVTGACVRLWHIEDLDEIWVGWKQREDKILRKTVEVSRGGRSLILNVLREDRLNGNIGSSHGGNQYRSVLEKSKDILTLYHQSSNLYPKPCTTPAEISRNSSPAYISSPIGLANKLVQFNKRPLYSCSLKAAYTKTYERNLWYKEFQNTKNFA